MKNNSKKTNKQNTTRARAQAPRRRVYRRSKDDRRRILFSKKYETKNEKRAVQLSKQNERREARVVKYGSDSVDAVAADFNKRFVAAFMALVFVLSMLVVGVNFAAQADEETTVTNANLTPSSLTGSGFVTSKKLSVNNSGNYDLTLEAYSTGATIVEQVPTDIILVLDQSGSMAKDDMPVSYNDGVTTNWYIPQGESDVINKYYFDGENYYRVYRKRGYMYEYHAPDTIYIGDVVSNTPLSWFQGSDEVNQDIVGQYYYMDTDGTMYPTTFNVAGKLLRYDVSIRYTNNSGASYYLTHNDSPKYRNWLTGGDITSDSLGYKAVNVAVKELFSGYSAIWGWNNQSKHDYFLRSYTYAKAVGLHTGMFIQNPLFTRHIGYNQLCYKDENGVEQVLIDADYCNSSGAPVGGLVDDNGKPTENYTSTNDAMWNGTLYTPTSTTTRLAALNGALKSFIEGVANQTNGDGTKPDHRIAVVGFSSPDSVYKNTELLTGTDLTITDTTFEDDGAGSTRYSLDEPDHSTAHNGKQYSDVTSANYANALLQVNDSSQYEKLDKAVDSITAYGGTEPKYGFYMAHSILENRDSSSLTYTKKDGTTGSRNQVIIFFTDGQPGNYSSDNQYAYANETVAAAYQIKSDNSIGDTPIYSIGTFGEADANPLLYQKTIRRSSYSSDNAYLEDRLNMLYSLDYDQTVTDSGITQTSSGYSVSYSAVFTAKFRIWQADSTNFPSTASDTIADYMETVSSKYPNATQFVDSAWYGDGTKSGTYASMVQSARGDAASSQYYYLATNQNALYKAFNKIFESVSSNVSNVTLDSTNSLVRDVLSDEFKKTDRTVVSLSISSGNVTSEGVVGNWGAEVSNPTGISANWTDDKTLDVTGFDFSENYISTDHPGNKLIIRINNVAPVNTVSGNTNTGDLIYSNTAEIGIFIDGNESPLAIFPQPSISRHSYELEVGSANSNATVSATYKIVDADGTELSASDLADVVVQLGDTRQKLTSLTDNTAVWTNSGNGYTMYFENLPSGAKVLSNITFDDTSGSYTYSLSSKDKDSETSTSQAFDTDFSLDYTDSVLSVTPIANNRTVIIKETVDGKFANANDEFTPTLYLVPPEGQQVPAEGATYGDVNWEIDGTNNRLKYTTKAILGNNTDSVSLTVPANWKLVVEQTDSDNYEVTDKEYVLGTSGTSTDIPAGGVDITDNLTITITNTRDNIPVTGVNDSSNFNWIIYILAALAGLAAIGAGIFLWKKRNEFVEE